jgi:hypothetical protein
MVAANSQKTCEGTPAWKATLLTMLFGPAAQCCITPQVKHEDDIEDEHELPAPVKSATKGKATDAKAAAVVVVA